MLAGRWRTNGHLIADLAKLGILTKDQTIIDLTYGRGVFWSQWQPGNLIGVTYGTGQTTTTSTMVLADDDFTALQRSYPAADVVVFDLLYMPAGSKSPTLGGLLGRYGIARLSSSDIEGLISNGLNQAVRVCKPGGTILTKSGQGINGGKRFSSSDIMRRRAHVLGLHQIDEFVFITTPRTQKHRGHQKNARSNFSTLTIWHKPSDGHR
jgi:hypothetical protein